MPSQAFRLRYAQAQAILAAQRAGLPLPPPLTDPDPDADDQPALAPTFLSSRWVVQSLTLSPGKTRYIVGLPLPFFAIVRECGKPLATTSHILEIYKAQDTSSSVDAQSTPKNLQSRTFTPPFIFHSIDQAKLIIAQAINATGI